MTLSILNINQLTIIPNSLALWGLGQMGLIIKGPDATIYIDPYLSNSLESQAGESHRRAYPIPLPPEQITNADFVLISHEHGDHLDRETVEPTAKASPQAKFVTNGWVAEQLQEYGIAGDRILTPTALEPLTLPGTSLRLTLLPAAHYEQEHDPQKGHRWLGFLLEWNGVTLYHSGDTILFDGYQAMMERLPTPDIALVAANGRDFFRESQGILGNLMPTELATIAVELKWGLVIPGHNDLFEFNTIPSSEHIAAFQKINPRQRFKFLQPEELLYFVKA